MLIDHENSVHCNAPQDRSCDCLAGRNNAQRQQTSFNILCSLLFYNIHCSWFFRHLPTSSNHRTLRYSAWVKSLPFFSQCRNSLWETFPSPPGRRTRLGTGRHVATLPPLPLSRSLHKTSTSLKVKSEFNLSEICQISLNLERKDAEEPSMDWKTSLISWESSKAIHSPLIAGSCTSATTPF